MFNNSIEVSENYSVHFDIELIHPDTGNIYLDCTISYDDYIDLYYESENDLRLAICKAIWNKYNNNEYYHSMIITTHYIVDNRIFFRDIEYNGLEIISVNTIEKTIV